MSKLHRMLAEMFLLQFHLFFSLVQEYLPFRILGILLSKFPKLSFVSPFNLPPNPSLNATGRNVRHCSIAGSCRRVS